MQDSVDYYNILGVQKNASFKEIKQAYRKLSLLYHPDKNKGRDSQKFKKITEAYQYLKVERRKENKKSKKRAEAAHAEFWNFYDKRTREDFNFHAKNFSQFRRGFEENTQPPSPNREKPISQKSTHLILYSGLAIVTIWIILTEILK